MPPRLPRKPLWRWEPFLLVMIVVSVTIGYIAAKLDLPVVTPLVLIAAVGGIVVCAWRLVGIVLAERRGPTVGGRLQTLDGFTLVRTDEGSRLALDESSRRQSSIDIAIAAEGSTPRAVLFPGATRWLGREIRTEVYLVSGTRLLPAGFLPARTEALLGDRLAELYGHKTLVEVPTTVRGAGKPVDPLRPYAPLERPFTVEIRLGEPLEAASAA